MINKNRIIPVLLLKENGLYKSFKFGEYKYIGDPINTLNIFNEKKVDEVIILDISDKTKQNGPNFEMLSDIAGEAFFPITYGGGIQNIEQAKTLMGLGYDKLSFCSAIYSNPALIQNCVKIFGAQSVVACLDIKVTAYREKNIYINNGRSKIPWDIDKYINLLKEIHVGELLVNDIQKDGTLCGYNIDLLKEIIKKIQIPIIACGGARSYEDISSLFRNANVSAAAGALFVYYGPYNAVLISYPSIEEKREILNGGK
jgi:Imidazoleglycerol-phosphate synthase